MSISAFTHKRAEGSENIFNYSSIYGASENFKFNMRCMKMIFMLHYLSPVADLKITEVYVNTIFLVFSRNALEIHSQRSLQHFFKNFIFFFYKLGRCFDKQQRDALPRIIDKRKRKYSFLINEMLLLALLTV